MCSETKQECAVQQTGVKEPNVLQRVQPLVDIFEASDSYQIVADVPGVEQSSITLKVENDALHLEAVAQVDSRNPAIKRPFQQLRYTRSFKLGRQVDREGISAEVRQGVLYVKLPKVQQAQPRQIAVRVGGDAPNSN